MGSALKIIQIQYGLRPSVHSKPTGGPDCVDPYKIMLFHQFLERRAILLAGHIGIRLQVVRIKLVPKPLGKPEKGRVRCDTQRSYDSTDIEFALGSAQRFFVFNLGGSYYKRYSSKTAEEPSNIQHALLGTVGRC
jgi:hypothetical protein